jgi:uncharacterized protein with NAD-binding domain and iron-sulfur cluster
MSETSTRRPRVALLGGGLGSLTTAYELSSRGFDVTVYQLGWRLGGQGASGRNTQVSSRIEEHGLHIWFGFYHNAFRMMREVYDALGRPAGDPLARVEDAFIGQDEHLFLERVNGEIRRWMITFPHDDGFPGTTDSSIPSLHEMLERLLDRAHDHAATNLTPHLPSPAAGASTTAPYRLERILGAVVADAHTIEDLVVSVGVSAALEMAARLAARVREEPGVLPHLKAFLDAVAAHIQRGMLVPQDDDIRRAFIVLDLAVTYARGLIADGALDEGLHPLDRFEFREWLTRHGASTMTVQSAVVQAFYDASFSYEDGRTDLPNVAAGVAIRSTLRILLGYQGHVVYKMAAGMGDTIFAPIYQVLKQRGVRFEFFHRVTSLEPGTLSAGSRGIAKVHLARQVNLKNGTYDPLIDVDGLPCWPSAPLTAQIENGEQLKGVNLESHWSGWPDVATLTLEAGRDYDVVVLGISLGALPLICQPLLAEDEPRRQQWADLFAKVKTIRTQAVQVWADRTSEELGWGPQGGIIACCQEPDASWADFSHLLGREGWAPSAHVSGVYYGCGPMPDSMPPIPPPDRTDFPAERLADAEATADSFLRDNATPLWPNAVVGEGMDPAVIASRYDRANIDPSERYVLAVSGGEFAKLPPDASGYTNLFLTGAWVDNGLNISSVEGTVMAGMACAAAVSGTPINIIGAGDL